jgi:hypothetical protein
MSKIFWNLVLAAPAVIGVGYANAAHAEALNKGATAEPAVSTQSADTLVAQAVPSVSSATNDSQTLKQINSYSVEGQVNAAGQVTSVSQFSDVKPTDWAYQALKSLVERYGCIVGYPDKTYRGNRALTRWEFAAGLNACLDKIQELIAAATADFVKKEDLETLKKLQELFAAELAALRGRVDALEVRTATLEKQQFSTTTKLAGEAIFALADSWGDAPTVRGNGRPAGTAIAGTDNRETIFADRVRLSFNSSFSGKDLLRIRLQARNITPFNTAVTGTNQTRLGFDGNEQNAVAVDKAFYRFSLGNFRLQIDATNAEMNDGILDTLSPFESSGNGAISRFGRFNPIFRANNPGDGSAGISFTYNFGFASFQGGYFTGPNANDPTVKNGLFNGTYAAIGQLIVRPIPTLSIGFTYINSYYPGNAVNVTGSTGTRFASNPFSGQTINGVANSGRALSGNSVGAQLQWRVSPVFTVGGWYGYTQAFRKSNNDYAEIQNWAAFLALPDLGGRGNLGGILFGQTPTVTSTRFRPSGANNALRAVDYSSPLQLEVFYRYRLNDNISLTPGVFVLFSPEGNSTNNTQYVGVLRTTFSF